jgi:hypothetical protein
MGRAYNKRISCTKKKVHYDFLSAMKHCASIQKQNPDTKVRVYDCEYCSGMHITSKMWTGKQWRYLKKGLASNIRVMGNPNFWEKAPPEIVDHFIGIEIELLVQLFGLDYESRFYETTIPGECDNQVSS